MNIAIDFDGTLDRAPKMFAKIIDLLQSDRSKVYLVTCREPTVENRDAVDKFLAEHKIDIPKGRRFFTNRSAKCWYLKTSYQLHIDIWIDDFPSSITNGM